MGGDGRGVGWEEMGGEKDERGDGNYPTSLQEDMAQYTAALEEVGADTAPLAYLRQWKSLSKMKNPRALGSYSASTTSVR